MPQATLDKLRFFTDTPDLSGESFPISVEAAVDEDAPPTSRVQIAKTGTYVHPVSGKAVITSATFDSMIRNFEAGIPTDRLPVDYDHAPETRGDTRACGWIIGLSQADGKLYADIEWTWAGAFSVRDREYRYVSISWTKNLIRDDTTRVGPGLYGLALTNRPFLESMAAVSLSKTYSRADLEQLAEEVEEDAPAPSDSPGRMEFSAVIREKLGLDAEATDEQVFEALKPDETLTFGGHATLEEAAKAEGKVLFTKAEADAAEAAKTDAQKQADRIKALEQKDADRAFSAIFDQGVKDLKLAPADEEDLRELFNVRGADKFAEYVERQTPLVNGTATGGRGDEADAPEGVEPDSFDIDREAKTYMAEHKCDYRTAVFAVSAQRERS